MPLYPKVDCFRYKMCSRTCVLAHVATYVKTWPKWQTTLTPEAVFDIFVLDGMLIDLAALATEPSALLPIIILRAAMVCDAFSMSENESYATHWVNLL